MRKGRSATLSLWVLALVAALLLGGCGPTDSTAADAGDPPVLDAARVDVRSQEETRRPDLPKPLAVSPDGAYVAVGLDGVTLYDRSGAGAVVAANGQEIRGLHWSPRGRWLLVNAAGPAILLIAPATGAVFDLTDQFPGLQDARLTVSWSPDEREALVAEGWHTVDQSTVWLLHPQSSRSSVEARLNQRGAQSGCSFLRCSPGGSQ